MLNAMLASKVPTRLASNHAGIPPDWHLPMLASHHAGMQPCWYAAMLVCNHAGMQPCWYAAMLVCSHAGMQPCWYAAISALTLRCPPVPRCPWQGLMQPDPRLGPCLKHWPHPNSPMAKHSKLARRYHAPPWPARCPALASTMPCPGQFWP